MPSGSCISLSYIYALIAIGSARAGYFARASSAAGDWLGFALSLYRIRGSEMRELPDSPALPCSLSYSLGAPVCVCAALMRPTLRACRLARPRVAAAEHRPPMPRGPRQREFGGSQRTPSRADR